MDEDLTFKVGEHEYTAGKLDAKRQFHIARRIAPLFGVIASHMSGGKVDEKAAIKDFLSGIGDIDDESADYVIDHCLSVVKRRENGVLCAISVPALGGKRVLQYQDIDMAGMLVIVFHVLRRNFERFFNALPSDLEEHLRGAMSITSP
jgi:hypothetical protein